MEGVVVFGCDECVICLEAVPGAVFSPCRHRCCCMACAQLVEKAKQTCPLCRSAIQDVLYYKDQAAVDITTPIDPAEIKVFKEERRESYIKNLRAPVTSDAGFKGKSKLARSVAAEVGDEMEQRRKETAGTERVTAKRDTIQFSIQGHDLYVDYKVGRAKRHEEFPLLTLEETRNALLECVAGDRVSLLDVATHYPDYYWVLRYHLGVAQNMSDYLEKDLGIAQQKRR